MIGQTLSYYPFLQILYLSDTDANCIVCGRIELMHDKQGITHLFLELTRLNVLLFLISICEVSFHSVKRVYWCFASLMIVYTMFALDCGQLLETFVPPVSR
jgi:hypothetical protein